MALNAPLKISDQANMIVTWLQPNLPTGSVAAVASNLRDMWEQATQSSDKLKVLVCFNGEVARGDFQDRNWMHRVDREWLVAVIRGRGYTSVRGDTLSKQVGNASPFYDQVELIRELLRRMLGVSEELPTIDYKSIRPMQLGKDVLDGYLVTFGTANDIPAIGTTPDDSPVTP